GLVIRGVQGLELGDVDVQPPETVLGCGLRPLAYPRLKLLQCDRGLCHPACLASPSECLRQGPFAPRALPRFVATTGPSARRSPSPRVASSARATTLLPRISPRDETPFPVSIHGLVHVLRSFTPPEGLPADRVRAGLLPSP